MDLVANATPAQLSHVFDLDLWRPSRPGLDEHFDVARFGLWLEVLAEAGAEVAAAKLAEMPLQQIVTGLAHHVDVFDVAAVSSYVTTDGTTLDYSRPVRDRVGCEIGGYHVAARREESWDAIVDVLVALDMHHPDQFVSLMRAVRSRSHSLRERDGFHALLQNREQMMFDAAEARERRRQERGFASPADARAFLEMSRTATLATLSPNPIARAYARSIETVDTDVETPAPDIDDDREVVDLLVEAGIVELQAPRALLTSGETEDTSSRLRRYMQHVFERDQAAYGDRNFELAYLANVLISGCQVQGRAFTAKEAADAAVAICNLGLEQLPDVPDYLESHDLIGPFQLGWAAIHEQACLFTARTLLEILSAVRVRDEDIQRALNGLRMRLMRELQKGTPWNAAGALEVFTSIDMPAWAALVGLIAECPVIHAGLTASIDPRIHSVDPNAFEFITTPHDLESVRTFMRALPDLLRV